MRSVTRGDALAALAGLLLLISSFLPFWTVDHCPAGATCSKNSWTAEFFPLLPSVVLAGVIGAALLVAARFLPKELRIAGLGVRQWGTALSATAAWAALWSLFSSMGDGVSGFSHGIGAYLEFVFAIVLTGAAVAAPRVPALEAPVLPTPRPGGPGGAGGPAGMGVGAAGPGGYGYQPQQSYPQGDPTPAGWAAPAAATPAGAAPSGGGAPSGVGAAGLDFGQPAPAGGGAPQQTGGPYSGGPQGGAAAGTQAQTSVPQPTAPQAGTTPPGAAGQPSAQPATGQPAGQPAFAPFWFAVPAQRRLTPEDDPAGPPIGELNPGVWYLAVGERGSALIAQTQDGRRGLLADTTGIQRG